MLKGRLAALAHLFKRELAPQPIIPDDSVVTLTLKPQLYNYKLIYEWTRDLEADVYTARHTFERLLVVKAENPEAADMIGGAMMQKIEECMCWRLKDMANLGAVNE